MPASVRIARLSAGLYWLCSLLMAVLPVVVLWGLATSVADPGWMAARFADLPAVTRMTPGKAALANGIGAVSLPVLLLTFAQMRGLFARYRQGEILSDPCALHVLRIGQSLVVLAGLGVLLPTLQRLALTFDNPPGARVLAIGLDSGSLGMALAGGLLVVIGWVMREASRELAEFV